MQKPETKSHVLLLDYKAAANALSLSPAALRDLVYKGHGPIVTRIGRRTFFAVKDLEDFVDQHRECAALATASEAVPEKRKRGRPTISDRMARDAAFEQRP